MGKNKKRNTAARRAQNNKQAVEEPQAPVSAEEVQKPHIPELQVGEIRAADPEPMSSDKATTDIPETPRKIEDTTPDSHETATPGEQNSESDEPDEPVEQQDLGEMTTSTVSEITESTIEVKAVPTEPLEQEEPNTSLAQPQPAETSQQTTSEGPSVVSEPIAPETERAPEPEQHKPQPDTIADVPRSTTTSLPVEHRSSPSEAATEHTEPQQTAKEEEVRLDVSSVTTQPPCEPAAAVASVPELPEAKHEHCVTIGNTRGSHDYSSRSEIIKAVHGTNNAVNGLMDSIVPSARPKKQSRVCCSVQ